MTDEDYADDPVFLINTPAQDEFILHSMEEAARSIGLNINTKKKKTEFICFNQEGALSSLNCKPLNSVDQFIYFCSNSSSVESNINIRKAWTDLTGFLSYVNVISQIK